MNRKTIKAKELKLDDKFFYNGYEYTVKYISEARVLGSSGVMGSKTDLHKETDVEVRQSSSSPVVPLPLCGSRGH